MNVKGFRGSVAGIPVRGGMMSINSADAATILNAASGLVRTTADVVAEGVHAIGRGLKFVGGVTLAIGILTLLIDGLLAKPSPKIPILSLAQIRTLKRNFLGICALDTFECVCDGEKLKIPTHTINSISSQYFGLLNRNQSHETFLGYNVDLIDGSSYRSCMPVTRHLPFLTICGEQKAILFQKEKTTKDIEKGFFLKRVVKEITTTWAPYQPESFEAALSIKGVTVEDLADLRQRLAFALENNLDKVVEIVGKETFEEYFILS